MKKYVTCGPSRELQLGDIRDSEIVTGHTALASLLLSVSDIELTLLQPCCGIHHHNPVYCTETFDSRSFRLLDVSSLPRQTRPVALLARRLVRRRPPTTVVVVVVGRRCQGCKRPREGSDGTS